LTVRLGWKWAKSLTIKSLKPALKSFSWLFVSPFSARFKPELSTLKQKYDKRHFVLCFATINNLFASEFLKNRCVWLAVYCIGECKFCEFHSARCVHVPLFITATVCSNIISFAHAYINFCGCFMTWNNWALLFAFAAGLSSVDYTPPEMDRREAAVHPAERYAFSIYLKLNLIVLSSITTQKRPEVRSGALKSSKLVLIMWCLNFHLTAIYKSKLILFQISEILLLINVIVLRLIYFYLFLFILFSLYPLTLSEIWWKFIYDIYFHNVKHWINTLKNYN
jgi:hypothetical protein